MARRIARRRVARKAASKSASKKAASKAPSKTAAKAPSKTASKAQVQKVEAPKKDGCLPNLFMLALPFLAIGAFFIARH